MNELVSRILVIGGTCRTGQLIVERSPRDGYLDRALARNRAAVEAKLSPGTEIVGGDITVPASLAGSFAGIE
jgi:uncharacterized protein YbjT (DUF2867 family)